MCWAERDLGSGSGPADGDLWGSPGSTLITQVTGTGDQVVNCEGRKNSGSILKIQLIGFADGLDVECGTKGRVQNDSKLSSLSGRKDGVIT